MRQHGCAQSAKPEREEMFSGDHKNSPPYPLRPGSLVPLLLRRPSPTYRRYFILTEGRN